MPGEIQPLSSNFAVVDERGFPTDYFIRWAQSRQIDISGGITAAQAQTLIDDTFAARQIIAGVGLDGGGALSADVTVNLADTAVVPATYGDATHVAQISIDQQGRITGAADVPIASGGGGLWWFAPPAAAIFTTAFTGDGTSPTLSDDADAGMLFQLGAGAANNIVRGKGLAPTVGVDWSLEFRFTREILPAANCYPGIAFYNSANSRLILFTVAWETSTDSSILRLTEFSLTGFNAHLIGINVADISVFGRVDYSFAGGTLKFYYSINGKIWHLAYTYNIAASYLAAVPNVLGPAYVGYVGAAAVAAAQGLSLQRWILT